jgi:hypothetical protein
MLVGGEALSSTLSDALRGLGSELTNLYGPVITRPDLEPPTSFNHRAGMNYRRAGPTVEEFVRRFWNRRFRA